MKTIAIPVSVFQVECEIASGRPFALAERTVLRSIAAGTTDFEVLVAESGLHPRMIAECITALFEAGIVVFQHGTGQFSLSEVGREALADPQFVPSTLRCVRKPYRIVVDRITGLADIGWNVTWERTKDLQGLGITSLPPSDIDPTPGRSAVRRLIERHALSHGEWVRSVGRPEPWLLYNNSVRLDVRNGRLEGLRSAEWAAALTVALRARGLDLYEEPPDVEADAPWIKVDKSEVRAIWGASDHSALLEKNLEEAKSYVFIHSAFLTGSRAEQLEAPISRAVRRGVDVLIARGGTEETSSGDSDGVAIFKKLNYDLSSSRGRFFFEPFQTGSHAKLLVRDGEQLCIGSFNWLSAPTDSTRPELSLDVLSTDLAAAACDVAADLFRDGRVAWPAQVLRSRPYFRAPHAAQSGEVDVRLVLDAGNRACVFAYLDDAQQQVVIASGKVTDKEDPFLREKLLQATRKLALGLRLALRFSSIDGDHAPLIQGLRDAGAVVIQDGRNHVKAALLDDRRALVTSFNLLSFGGHSWRRSSVFEMGIEIKFSDPSRQQFQVLFGPLYAT